MLLTPATLRDSDTLPDEDISAFLPSIHLLKTNVADTHGIVPPSDTSVLLDP